MTAPRLPFDRRRLLATICIAAGALPVSAAAQNGPKRRRLPEAAPSSYASRPDALRWAEDMAARRDLPPDWVRDTIGQAQHLPNVPRLMLPPARGTAKNWRAYRSRFIDATRIRAGARFWQRNRATLARAQQDYGVPPEIVVGIIGVETIYGQNMGSFRVLDALATLSFDFPPQHPRAAARQAFFQDELAQYLSLCQRSGMDPQQPLGSYAGAMGMPQFMPSSYRKLAADGDGDGRRDIWNNPADAIASVANYFARNGWRAGEPIAVPARVSGDGYRDVVSTKNPKASLTLGQLTNLGVTPAEPVGGGQKVGLLQLAGENGPEFWITFHNFSVIMRYNHSPLYAMAATELVREWRGGPGR